MLMLNTDKKVAREESKSKNSELKKIEKKKQNKCLQTQERTTCTMNEEKQVKNLLARFREYEGSVLFANEDDVTSLINA